MRKAIVKGLQRSGTNYLAAVLGDNFRLEVLWDWKQIPGGKHLPHVGGPAGAPMFVSLKDPYAWMHSLWRHTRKPGRSNYSQAKSFACFLRQELRMPTAVGQEVFYRPVTAWLDMNKSWLAVTKRKVIPVQCEMWLDSMARHNWVTVMRKWLPARKGEPRFRARVPVSRDFKPGYYLQRRYMEAWSREDLRYVNDFLAGNMKETGYECVSR